MKYNICPSCGGEVGSQDRFCGNCGSSIKMCAACGSANLSQTSYCHLCGTRIARERITKPSGARIAKAVALVAVLIIAVVIATTILLRSSQYTYVPTPQVTETPQAPPPYVRLRVEAYEAEAHWTRDYSTDLPLYNSLIVYAAYNDGTAQAENVVITITVDGGVYQQLNTFIGSGSYTTDRFQLSFNYDTFHEVSVSASHRQSTDTTAISINAILPRSWSVLIDAPELCKLFVTPNDPIVRNTLNRILQAKGILATDYDVIKDWVASNIQYAFDSEVHGGEYWQLPRETLQRGTGDCEDYAILLVSLYRAVGYDADRVYVVLGDTPEGLHGWVRIKLDIIGWRYLEPQWQGSYLTIILSESEIQGTAEYLFNDVYAYQVT